MNTISHERHKKKHFEENLKLEGENVRPGALSWLTSKVCKMKKSWNVKRKDQWKLYRCFIPDSCIQNQMCQRVAIRCNTGPHVTSAMCKIRQCCF